MGKDKYFKIKDEDGEGVDITENKNHNIYSILIPEISEFLKIHPITKTIQQLD